MSLPWRRGGGGGNGVWVTAEVTSTALLFPLTSDRQYSCVDGLWPIGWASLVYRKCSYGLWHYHEEGNKEGSRSRCIFVQCSYARR
jgi:hypothetical protein